jgi:lipopolysaccharide transport system permease protein
MTSGSAPFEKTYSAETARHTVLASLLPVAGYPLMIWRHRYLVHNFFRRDLLGRFRGSSLGLFWVLVHPIVMFVVYYLVFGYLFGNPKTGNAPTPDYALYLFSGVIAFTALNEGITRSCTCVVDNGNLVKKVAFPSELLPVPLIMVSLVVYLVGALVCVCVGLTYGVLAPGWSRCSCPSCC